MLANSSTGNIGTVRNAVTPARLVREQQAFPFRGWYAVIVRSGREQDAADAFRRDGVLAYWPNYQRQVASGRTHRRCVFASIIPGMLFSPIADETLFWMAIGRIPQVINMLRGPEGVPAILSNADIENLRRIEADENMPPKVTPVHTFKVGQPVRLSTDICSGWPNGKVSRLASDGRISVDVYLMGRMVPIWVLPHQIEAIQARLSG